VPETRFQPRAPQLTDERRVSALVRLRSVEECRKLSELSTPFSTSDERVLDTLISHHLSFRLAFPEPLVDSVKLESHRVSCRSSPLDLLFALGNDKRKRFVVCQMFGCIDSGSLPAQALPERVVDPCCERLRIWRTRQAGKRAGANRGWAPSGACAGAPAGSNKPSRGVQVELKGGGGDSATAVGPSRNSEGSF